MDVERAKRQMLHYFDDELFLGLESELEGIVDWDWLAKAVVDAANVDLIAELRRGVESGTIKGEVVRWCDNHDAQMTWQNEGQWECWDAERFHECVLGFRLLTKLVPVSDGGSET